MPLLHFAGCHRPTFALDPFDQPTLVAVIVGFGQQRVNSPDFGLDETKQSRPDADFLDTGYRQLRNGAVVHPPHGVE